MTPLLIHRHPLQGSSLIEASAGTGKTWTIATLFARLVVTSDGPTGQALLPEQILVLTFTRAATRELVDRIRRRLVECHQVLRGTEQPAADDLFIHDLLNRYPNGLDREQAIWRLERAAASMDSAAVTTIDAWVQRVLREHLAGTEDLEIRQIVESDEAWRRQAVHDYWREAVYPLEDAPARFLCAAISSPDALGQWLLPALRSRLALPAPPSTDLASALQAALLARTQAIDALRAHWRPHHAAMVAWFAPRWSGPGKVLDGRRIRKAQVEQWFVQLEGWLSGSDQDLPPDLFEEGGTLSKAGLKLLPEGLRESHLTTHQHHPAPDWSHAWATLAQGIAALPEARHVLAEHALGWVHHRLQTLKLQRGIWSFDDLLARLETALEANPRLASRLRSAYPAALIDEFQDTSERQLRVFDRIYDIAANDPNAALLLIGDPKQSIYRFRGADIHSYLQARKMTTGRHVGLMTNRRSVQALVQSVNHLFRRAEERAALGHPPDESGAFRHGPEVPFVAVDAQSTGPRESLEHRADAEPRHEAAALPVLSAWMFPEVLGGPQAREQHAERAAERLSQLLQDPSVGFRRADGVWRRIVPSDVAILVRTGTEAAAMRRALRRRQIPCAYLSERDLVLHTQEARDVLAILEAMRHPQDLQRTRQAWGTSLLGLPWAQQRTESSQDALWDRRAERMRHWGRVWQDRGVLAALRGFLLEAGVASACLADRSEGERRLTNALHLSEWLQEASLQARSPQSLIDLLRHTTQSQSEPWRWPPGIQTQLLRLESEADLVRIVTLHKSKGLQYPIVMMPFVCQVREERATRRNRALVLQGGRWQPASGGMATSAVAGQSAPPSEALEEDRENLRLLYVGLTRAVHQVWLGLSPSGTRSGSESLWHRSAFGQLVSGPLPREGAQAVADVQGLFTELTQAGLGVRLENLSAFDPEAVTPWPGNDGASDQDGSGALRPARRMSGPVDRSWRVSSYSALVRQAVEVERWDEDPLTRAVPFGDPTGSTKEESPMGEPPPGNGACERAPWHDWPSNAAFGELLHGLLEEAAASRFDFSGNPGLRALLAARLAASAWAAQATEILRWLESISNTPLPPWGAALSQMGAVRAELEFWMPVLHLHTAELDAICQRHVWPGARRPTLAPQRLRGLLMGFADLVLEHGGRWGVLDYKSNRLGDEDAAYGPEALQEAVLAHRYDVQASVYLLALHRLLQRRLPLQPGVGYQPEIHLGPVQFLFLRGIGHPTAGLLSLAPSAAWIDDLERLVGRVETST